MSKNILPKIDPNHVENRPIVTMLAIIDLSI